MGSRPRASQATRRDCEKAGFDAAKLSVIPLGVEPRVVTEQDIAAVRHRYDLPREYVLWTGTIEPGRPLCTQLMASGPSLGSTSGMTGIVSLRHARLNW